MTEVFPDVDGAVDDQPTGTDDHTDPVAAPVADPAAGSVAGPGAVVRLPIDPAEPMACWLASI